MIKYRITTETGYIETLNKPDGINYDEIEFNPNDGEYERIIAEKQSLLNSIKPLQTKVMTKNSDVWVIKFQDSENDDELTTEEKKTNKDLNKKVIKWRKKVRRQNNNITIDNTLEEIQARIDRINELDNLFPEIERN